jgi:hypothetical protein
LLLRDSLGLELEYAQKVYALTFHKPSIHAVFQEKYFIKTANKITLFSQDMHENILEKCENQRNMKALQKN